MKADFESREKENFKVKLIKVINMYIKKREKAEIYARLIYDGKIGIKETNKMLKAILFKPNELKKYKAIENASNLHKRLLNLIENEEITSILSNKVLIEHIKDFKITELTGCNQIYDICKYAGVQGQKELGFLFIMLFKPIGVTIIEFILICIVVTIWIYIKMHIL